MSISYFRQRWLSEACPDPLKLSQEILKFIIIDMMDVLRRPSSFKPHSCEGNLPQRLKLDMMISIIARGGAKRSRHDIIQTELQLHLNTSPPFEYWNNAEVELGI
jgi:hypothetical protein